MEKSIKLTSVMNSFNRSKVRIATVNNLNKHTFDFSYRFYLKISKNGQDDFFSFFCYSFFLPISPLYLVLSGYFFDLSWNYCYCYNFDCLYCLCCFFTLLPLVLNYYCCLFLDLHVKFVILKLNYEQRFFLNFVYVGTVWNDLALVKL